MELFFEKAGINLVLTLSETEVKKYATDRVILIQLCMRIIKNQTASKDFIALLNQELINTDQTELAYLIGGDKKKQYLSWFILIVSCAVLIKNKDWVKEHEATFFAVLASNYTDEQLRHLWCKLPDDVRCFRFATVKEVQNTDGFLNINRTYVKVPCTQISKNLSKINNKIILKGYLFIDYESNIRDLLICRLEQEWESIWREQIENRAQLTLMFNGTVFEEIDNFLYTKRTKPVNAIIHSYPIPKQTLPKMADEYFPPCMTTMWSSFNTYGELKHDARKQLMLFLKDVNVPKSDILDLVQINYNRPHLVDKKMQVVYYMRHLLGMTDQARNYDSYNCHQIQEHPVADGLAHGCYFKKTSKRVMENDLAQLGLPIESRNLIHSKVREKEYSAACTLHLKCKYGLETAPSTIAKPNGYFDIARCCPQIANVDIEDVVKWAGK